MSRNFIIAKDFDGVWVYLAEITTSMGTQYSVEVHDPDKDVVRETTLSLPTALRKVAAKIEYQQMRGHIAS